MASNFHLLIWTDNIIVQPAGGCLLAMGSMIYKEISRCNNTL